MEFGEVSDRHLHPAQVQVKSNGANRRGQAIILCLMQYIDHILQVIQRELRFEYIRASGPGGQNINKVATAVQLRFNLRNSAMPEIVKERLFKIAGKRISTNGLLVIEAKRFRTQEQNRQDATERLIALIRKSLEEPKPRKRTKPTQASQEKRLKVKKRLSNIKRIRRDTNFE